MQIRHYKDAVCRRNILSLRSEVESSEILEAGRAFINIFRVEMELENSISRTSNEKRDKENQLENLEKFAENQTAFQNVYLSANFRIMPFT